LFIAAMKRRDFVHHICPSIVLVHLATAINSCKDSAEPVENVPEAVIKEFASVSTRYNDEGYYMQGNLVYVNLSNPNLSKLGNNLGYANLLDAGVLLLRTDVNTLKAFSNCCPHQGNRAAWVFEKGRFKCENHGNSYNVNEINTVSCASNSISGGLIRFELIQYKNYIRVSKL
jgi:Rieske Fe-S protein